MFVLEPFSAELDDIPCELPLLPPFDAKQFPKHTYGAHLALWHMEVTRGNVQEQRCVKSEAAVESG